MADGQTTDAPEEPEKTVDNQDGKSDGCIGSRRVRTFLIGGLLIVYNLLAVYYFVNPGWANMLNGIASLVLCGACIFLVILHCCKKDGPIETIVGWVIFICGIIQIVVIILNMIALLPAISIYGFLYLFTILGQGVLPACTAIFLGLDAIKNFMGNEGRRLFANLLVLAISAGISCLGWIDFGRLIAAFLGNPGGLILCGGYGLLTVFSVIYIILNFCGCICQCNCDENCFVRKLLSIGLIVGAAAVGIGWFMISAFVTIIYAVLQAVFIVGISVVWALDMGLTDQPQGGGESTEPQSA